MPPPAFSFYADDFSFPCRAGPGDDADHAMVMILARRVMQAVLVLLLVALISFTIFRFVGDPVENILGQEAVSYTHLTLPTN